MASRTAHLIAKLTDEVSGPAKGMAGALKGAAAAAKDLGKGGSPALDRLTRQLKEAERQAEIFARLQDRMKAFGEARTAFSGARQNVERISRELQTARKTLSEFDGVKSFARGGAIAQEMEAARKQVRDLEREMGRAQTTVRSTARDMTAEKDAAAGLKRTLGELGVPTKSLSGAQTALTGRIEAATHALERQARAEQRLKRIREAPGALAARMGITGKGHLGPLSGAIGAYGAASAYKQAAAFDRRMTMIGQTADATRPEIDGLAASVHDLAQQTATPVDKVAGGLESLVAQGRNLKEAMDFLPSVTRTAAASGSEVEDIAKTADSVSTNFKIAGKSMQTAFDIMAAGGKAGQFELKDMSRYLPSLAPAASAVGMKAEKGLADVVAMLQVIRKGTGTTEEAATSLTNIFSKLESEETTKRFKKMGVDLEAAMKKGRKEGRNLIEVFEEAAQKATKGDLSLIPKLIQDQEFARGVRALMTYRGEWQKLSSTLQSSAGGTVLRDLAQVTKDSQAGLDRVTNSALRTGQALAKLSDAGGASSGLGSLNKELESVAGVLERINKAYSEGGLSGALGQAASDAAEHMKEVRKDWLEHRGKQEDGRITELEAAKEAHRKKLAGEGRSPAEIADAMRIRDKEIDRARRRRGAVETAKQDPALADKKPLRMGVDPTAPIQGKPGEVGPGLTGFQDAYPIDTSKHLPPKPVPLPPNRPSGIPRGINSIDDVLGPKVDTSQIDAVGPKADEAKGKLSELGAVSVTPTVDTSSLASAQGAADRLLATIRQIGPAAQAAGAAAAAASANTGKVASALAGAAADRGMG